MIISILFLGVFGILLGFSVKDIFKIEINGNCIEKILILLSLGIGIFPLLTNILNLMGVPLDYRIYLVICILYPSYWLIKNWKDIKFPQVRFTKSIICSMLLLIILISYFFFFLHGSEKYPYLEDDDPWSYAEAAKAISVEKTYSFVPKFNIYLEPYPSTFPSIMGIVHQTNNSVFVGSTKDLQNLLNKERSTEKNVIDAEVVSDEQKQ